MVKVSYTKTQGKCFAEGEMFPCNVMEEKHPNCGTFFCPFYKPADLCEGDEPWVRIDQEDGVLLIPPEEYRLKGVTWQ